MSAPEADPENPADGGASHVEVRDLFDGVAESHDAVQTHGFRGWLSRRDDRALMKLLQPSHGLEVLEVGCGSGRHSRQLVRAGLRVCALDLSPKMVELVRPHVAEAHVADLDTLSLGRQFDRVTSIGVLDFVDDPARCMANLAAHVREGGRLVIEVPRRSIGGYIYRLVYRLHRKIAVHIFGRRELDAMVKKLGLRPAGYEYTFFHCMFIAWTKDTTVGPTQTREG
jgi:SAM-dependent methyltransferase